MITCWEVLSGDPSSLCCFHFPGASLNDAEGVESRSSLQGICWDKLDSPQSPELSCISRYKTPDSSW